MTNLPNKYGLNALLYFLNYIPDVNSDPILPENLISQIKTSYKPELVSAMCEALQWANNNKDYDYTSQLPLRQSNAQILVYLDKVHTLFEKEGLIEE